jgi:integrase
MSKQSRRTFGTTRQESSGHWSARYPFEGRRVSVGRTFPTKKAAEARLAKIQTDLGKGTHVDPIKAEGTLGEWWEHYSSTKTDWSPRTREEREGLWSRYIEPVFATKSLNAITATSVRSWYAALHAKRPATAQGAYRLLRQVLSAAIADNRLVVNPCKIKGAGVDKAPERRTATLHEVEVIVDNLPEHMRLMVLLATYCGLRLSELLGLQRSDIDTLHGTVTIARSLHELEDGSTILKEPKTKAGRRTLNYPPSIHDDVVDHLERFVGRERDALVFVGERSGEALRPGTFGMFYRRARAAAGRPDLRLHDLRHTSLTLAAATGATLPELMHRAGHSTPHASLRYLHATQDRDRIISDALSELRPIAPVVDLGERKKDGATE